MVTEGVFCRLPADAAQSRPLVDIEFNGSPLQLEEGMTLAAALLLAGVRRFRSSPVSGQQRAPYCMMGACFECLVEIDGVPSQQSCLAWVRAGMKVRTQEGARRLEPEAAAVFGQEVSHG